MNWTQSSRTAWHWHRIDEDRVECTLCPRHCRPRDGQTGFCRVRGAVGGELHTFNYGKSVAASEEVIETEAVYHFAPGARILSLGNIGCMMACDFCQNWETSQVKHLDPSVVNAYTPESIVDLCLASGIDVLSWTYNDPVVWHEFVVTTSRLAQRHGIRTLYKSAFYIEAEPTSELIDCIDIFSLSLKSMDESFYRRITKGRLGPVLHRIEQVHRSGRHVEISQLVIPERNDGEDDAAATARWIVDRLGPDVPLHFVGFHPAYRYTDVERTPVDVLERARTAALGQGIRYCYLGNVHLDSVSDTLCTACGETLVSRFGLSVHVAGVTPEGNCTSCGQPAPIREPHGTAGHEVAPHNGAPARLRFAWQPEIRSVHVATRSADAPRRRVQVVHEPGGEGRWLDIGGGVQRVLLTQRGPDDTGFALVSEQPIELVLYPVLDRAHFATSTCGEDSR